MHTTPLSLFIAITGLLLAGCASTPVAHTPAHAASAVSVQSVSTAKKAVVHLASASGSLVSGQLTLVPTANGVHVTGAIGGLKANAEHGFHIHEKGDCSAVDASSAGGHFNPESTNHGRAGHGAHHAGDADNLIADSKGIAHVDVQFAGVTLGGAAANDVANRAVIVHAAADDYSSQPAGNAGARVACGIIKIVE